MFTPPTSDAAPSMQAGVLKSIRHIDHVTYVAKSENERKFISQWESLGFREHVRLNTPRWPATHIALVSGATAEYPWATMTGLSVSTDIKSPINEFIKRYGEGIQHTAYNIDPEVDMVELHSDMEKLGWVFMTPVLTYKDSRGARLRQMFAAPASPFGPFVEFIQRLPGEDGQPFDGFDNMNIDDLYDLYNEWSEKLLAGK